MPNDTPDPNLCDGARQILAAAVDAFAAHGYEGASIHTIAELAGVSKANVFHHFASKEQLYLAVLRKASQSWYAELAPVADSAPHFAEQLRAMVGRILDHLTREGAESRVVLREMLENGALHGRELSEDILAPNFRIETEVFRRAQANGELRDNIDPALAWMMTMSACAFFFQTRDVMRFNPELPYADAPQRYADGLCDLLLRGIAAPSSRPL
ncbi:MAG TPA: TetR/AcrR family transcriptional regulator [Nevskiaceae bacterium]|nr:TetR/AcrR family transcriptional regulator [Nevskiaceae bacterium]